MIDINSIFTSVKKSYTKDNFIQLTENNFDEIKEQYNKKVKPGIERTYVQISSMMHDVGLNINNVYFSKGHYQPFTYRDGFFYLSQNIINDLLLNRKSDVVPIKRSIDRANDLVKENNFEHLFMFVDSKYHILLLEDIYDIIPMEQKYNIFTYINSDYGLKDINHDIVRDLLKFNLDKSRINELKSDKEGYIIIYRGVEDLSSPLDRAYSWTMDKKTAEFFGNRFKNGTGILYKAKVKLENIIDYNNNREEKLILVLPEHVEDITVDKRYKK